MTDSTIADTESNRRSTGPLVCMGASAVVAIVAALAGHAIQWRWLTLTALLVLLVGSSAAAVWAWRDTRGGRFGTAVMSGIAAVAGWIVTVWLVEFPPVMVTVALGVAGFTAIAAIGTGVTRRLDSGCFGYCVGTLGQPAAAAAIVHEDRAPATEGEQR
ncbi:hypothetical protein BJF87_19735 [Gordonia sp. CNJ-863]|uniref:hypothetical protein n=1 Tax=Gordonia sp. CNJ-863 TaxID=1904963 RepID=UPI00095C6F2D|nr:hypothetical protein [Gordonia sp. CNJ-863]OLT48666.1 hypothetical protein BJF87_19735 [Gordonia sp. CNJ-863]